MRRAAIAGVLWLCLGASLGAQATVGQTATPDRPGPWVVDIRGTTISLPQDAPFFPDIPSSTAVPSRGYGIDVGAHIYVLQLGPARLGHRRHAAARARHGVARRAGRGRRTVADRSGDHARCGCATDDDRAAAFAEFRIARRVELSQRGHRPGADVDEGIGVCRRRRRR